MLSSKIRFNAERLAYCQVQYDGKEAIMKRWQKTEMEWDCILGLETNMPVTDWHEPKKKYVHTIHEITATALPDRKGEVKLRIQRVCIGPTTERQAIKDLLSNGLEKCADSIFRYTDDHSGHITVKNDDIYSGVYELDFSLTNGDQFCDTAIRIVKKAFELLGVEDDGGFRLSDFTVKQETYIQLEKAWITFANWLRIQHRLPIHLSDDAGD